jgi:hypothetical protein
MALPPDLQADMDREISVAQKFSFDIEEAGDLIEHDRMEIAIIRAHLYVDHVLTKSIEDALTYSDALDLQKLGFGTKLGLAIGLGIIPKTLRAAILCINNWRNELAHNLHFSITEKERRECWNTLPEHMKLAVARVEKADDMKAQEVPLSKMVMAIVYMMDIFRQQEATRKIEFRFSQKYLERALDNRRAKVGV